MTKKLISTLEVREGKRFTPSTFTAYTIETCDSCGYIGCCIIIGSPPVLCRRCLEAAVAELRKMEES